LAADIGLVTYDTAYYKMPNVYQLRDSVKEPNVQKKYLHIIKHFISKMISAIGHDALYKFIFVGIRILI